MEKRIPPSFIWIYVVGALVILAAIVAGIDLLNQQNARMGVVMTGAALLAAGSVGLIALLIVLPVALAMQDACQSSSRHEHELMTALEDRLQSISVLMNLISEQQLISDRAKTVAFREHDREAVRRAIHEEMNHQDWEAALVLANDIEVSFGYKQEADRYKDEINSKREEVRRRQVAEYLLPVDYHIKNEAWGMALQEAQKVMAAYPSDAQVQRLPEEIENRRQMRKQQLRDSWQDAINRHDVDGSIEILKMLDLYLTPAEAESMQEIARNVFREKREALRIRFQMAVQERRWTEALRVGDEIINDFPNTRIAQEVREKMEALRKLSEEPEMTPA
ncbi:MAG: hypothetical protein M3O30_17280 [Planctomycetota bacterium]|nr:hypothetical protein [Planctomycetota bacterium]